MVSSYRRDAKENRNINFWLSIFFVFEKEEAKGIFQDLKSTIRFFFWTKKLD